MRREMMFAVVMIAVIVSVCIPIMSDEDSEASTDYDFIYSGIGYTINGDSATVVHSYGTRDVEIPETVYHNGSYYTVTRISDLADGNDENTTLRTLTIPDTVTSVYGSAFSLCPNLDTINVSSDNPYYSSDSDGILYNKDHTILVRAPPAMSMDRYDVDYGVVTVGSHAFEGCQISRIYLSSTVETIESYAFSNTLSLEHVNLSNVENLHSNLMSGSSIEHVNIPQSVTSIDRSFDNAQSLISIYVNPTNTHFSSDDQGILYDYDGRTLIKCPEGISGDVVISNDITTIGEDAFYRCRDITSVVLPDSLEDIESGAFKNCRGLLSINIPSSVSHIANDAFDCAFYDEDGNRISASASSLAGHTYSNDTPGSLIRDWSEVPTHTISFDLNGGSGSTPESFEMREGETFELPSVISYRDGYTCNGWYYGGVTYPEGATVVVDTGDMNFRLDWEMIVPISIILNRTELTMEESDSFDLNATVRPSDAYDTSVTWSSSDTDVATVDQSGQVIAVGPGSAVITATTAYGDRAATCVVTVEYNIMGMDSTTFYLVIATIMFCILFLVIVVAYYYRGRSNSLEKLERISIKPPKRH